MSKLLLVKPAGSVAPRLHVPCQPFPMDPRPVELLLNILIIIMRTGVMKWGLLGLHRLSLNRNPILGSCIGAGAMMTEITNGVIGLIATGKMPHWTSPALTKELWN